MRTQRGHQAVGTGWLMLLAVGCSDASAPLWEDLGERREAIQVLVIDGPVTSAEAIHITGRGNTAALTHPNACRWESQRDSLQVDLTLWVRSERWVGADPAPPYPTTFNCETQVDPPLPEGFFRLFVHQPDGSTLVDSVEVTPEEETRAT